MSDKARYNLRRSRTSNQDSSDQASTTEPEQEEMSEIQADPEPEQPLPKIARSESRTAASEERDSRDSSVRPGIIDVEKDSGFGKNNISEELQASLNRLKNALKLPKARRFAYCEFFYSPVDAQIFQADNEFMCLVREHLPNLRTQKMRLCEWREIRRIIGKPRRLSEHFLKSEREALEAKRAKIRELYHGNLTQLDPESVDLPSKLPRPLMVGTKVFVWFYGSKETIIGGTVEAVIEDGYRVAFDNDFQSAVVRDDQVMTVNKQELFHLTYFLSTNKANMKNQLPGGSNLPPQAIVERMQQQPLITGFTIDPHSNMSIPVYGNQVMKKEQSTKNDKVGNFPVRMLVIIVKMCKLLDHKRKTLGQFTVLVNDAIKMQRYGYTYPDKFLKVVAEVIIELESINKMLKVYAEALNPYRQTLLNQRSKNVVTDRPEVLRKTCHNHATQILKHCSSIVDVKDQKAKEIIVMLSSLLLQIRFLGQHAVSSHSCAEEVQILMDSVKELKNLVPPEASQAFQDGVEVHIKQIFNTLLKVRPQNP